MILSALSPSELINVISTENANLLKTVKGIGLKIQHVLKKELDDNRYQHTLGVMYTAASMAMRYDVDVLKALYAGLLHDCAKCIPNDKKLHLCGKYGFTVSDIERENPSGISIMQRKDVSGLKWRFTV